MTPELLVRRVADAGARIWLTGDSIRLVANDQLPNTIVEELRQQKPAVVEVLRPLPACVQCGAKIPDCVTAWWGGGPVHRACGEAAWHGVWADAPIAAAPAGCVQ